LVRFQSFKLGYASSPDAIDIIKRDLREARVCQKNRAYKATMVMCGSALECALLEYLSSRSQEAKAAYIKINGKSKNMIEWDLGDALPVSRELHVFSDETYKLCDLLRSYRNLIHPSVERRKSIEPNAERADRSLAALAQSLKELDKLFDSIKKEVFVIDIPALPGRFISDKSIVSDAVAQMAQSRGLGLTTLDSLGALEAFIVNPIEYSIIINAHGELVPTPTSWLPKWREYFVAIGNLVKEKGITWVSMTGYPFWAYGQNIECGSDGLNAFLSVANASADCMKASAVSFTKDGRRVLQKFNMEGMPMKLLADRCADWKGAQLVKSFLSTGKLFGASAVRIGRGWFIQIGMFPASITRDQKLSEKILANLALAFALSV